MEKGPHRCEPSWYGLRGQDSEPSYACRSTGGRAKPWRGMTDLERPPACLPVNGGPEAILNLQTA